MIFYQYIDSPFGEITLVSDEQHLLGLLFGHSLETLYTNRIAKLSKTLVEDWKCGSATVIEDTKKQLLEYCEGKRQHFQLPLKLLGSEFQVSVWQALLAIPFGKTQSYKQIAARIGKPSAVRAVANANGANAIAIIIPCHRVISSDGSIGGYSGGIDKKEAMLKIEGQE
jgi:O-6-methylguanine DNA methyltransferase